jgi:molybdopterin-binding protein
MSTVDTTSITVQAAPYYSDQITPTGYIDLLVDGVIVNRLALAANATATFTLSSLTVGTHMVSATYEGDTNYNVNTHSNTMSIIVSKAIPSFVLSSSAPTLGLSIGGSASASLALQANNAFAGPVSLTCSGAPAGTTCSFSQNNVTLAPGQTVTSIVTIASVKSASLHQGKPIGAATGTGVALALCLMLPLVRRRKRVVTLLTTVVLVALLMNVAGCSGGTNANPQAPIGTYSVSVSATPSDTTVAAQSLTMLVTLSK